MVATIGAALRSGALALAGAFWLAATMSAGAQEPFREDNSFLRARIDGREIRLESLIIRPEGIDGRLPLALITHGKSATGSRMGDLPPSNIGPSRGISPAVAGWPLSSSAAASANRTAPFPVKGRAADCPI